MAKLNQVIAIEKGVKSRAHAEISELYKTVQKPALFNGFTKDFRAKSEGEEGSVETLPSERQRVQETVSDVLRRLERAKAELFDVTAQKDFGNTTASANVTVDGKLLIENAPVPFLLFLEKELTDLRTFILALPTLDVAEDWQRDVNSGLFRSGETVRQSTKKVQKPLVLYPATDKHPAQTQLITEDVTTGFWHTVKQSGAIPAPEKAALAERVDKLLAAVKTAREEANAAEAPKVEVGGAIFGYLFP